MLLLLLACNGSKQEDIPSFLIEPVDLGPAIAAGVGLDTSDMAGLGLSLWAALPIFGENPAFDAPMTVEELWHPEVVQDEGICPYAEVLSNGTRWESDCRSTDGYDFSGWLERREWSETEADYQKLEADFEVVGDVEGADFERLKLKGSLVQVLPDNGEVLQHLDLNLHLELEGYWELQKPTDPHLEAWQRWLLSGSLEQHRDGKWLVNMQVEVGEVGGFTARSSSLQKAEGCPVELEGELSLGEQLSAQLGGLSSCDTCAGIYAGDQHTGDACAP